MVGDALKPNAAAAVTSLRALGLRPILLTGDNRRAALAVAEAVGVDGMDVRAEALPGDKVAVIQELQHSGRVVAMVGDGVNDAPALAAADLGIALGSGADLAMQAAPVVLMSNSLAHLSIVFEIARTTLRVVRQNLFWAFFYNAAGITLAITGVLNPILAASAMVLSSLCVIGNSFRLRNAIAHD